MLLKERREEKSLSSYENLNFRKLGLNSQHKLTYNSTVDQFLKCSLYHYDWFSVQVSNQVNLNLTADKYILVE